MSKVEQVFQERFTLLLQSGLVSVSSISAALEALRHVEKQTGIDLDEALGAPLATHLAMALKRLEQGEILQPAPEVLWLELQGYPAQLEQAKKLIAELEKHTGLQIPSDEAGFIALHLARITLSAETRTEASNLHPPEEQ